RSIQVNQEGQITERFVRAIDQLGSKKTDVRLGGIYALERIANNSCADYGPIIEVLTAFLRARARPGNKTEPRADKGSPSRQSISQRLPADIEAVIDVLRRRKIRYEDRGFRLDLSGAHLPGAKLERTTLKGARLDGANLQGAWLGHSNLKGASLMGVDLQFALLDRTN